MIPPNNNKEQTALRKMHTHKDPKHPGSYFPQMA